MELIAGIACLLFFIIHSILIYRLSTAIFKLNNKIGRLSQIFNVEKKVNKMEDEMILFRSIFDGGGGAPDPPPPPPPPPENG